MGIVVEFNPDLALRNMRESKAGRRKLAECIPEKLEKGQVYDFLKAGLRNYWLEGEIPLLETKGDQKLSRPVASIVILESTQFMQGGQAFTKGKYRVVEVFNLKDATIQFEGLKRLN